MTDKGKTSKDMEPEASSSEVKEHSNDSYVAASRTADYLESGENVNSSAMMQVLKTTSPVTMSRSSSLEVLPGSPKATAASLESAAGCSKALASTSGSGTSFASSKCSETLMTATIPADDEDWNISKFDSLLHRYHNHHKKAKMDLEKIREVILSDQDVLRNAVEGRPITKDFVYNVINSQNFRDLTPNQQNKMRRNLLETDKNLICFLRIFRAEADVDFDNFKLLENNVTKNLADTVEYLKNAEIKAMGHMENSSSSASKLSLSAAVMWLNLAEKSLNITWHDIHSFLMNRKLDYERIFHIIGS